MTRTQQKKLHDILQGEIPINVTTYQERVKLGRLINRGWVHINDGHYYTLTEKGDRDLRTKNVFRPL